MKITAHNHHHHQQQQQHCLGEHTHYDNIFYILAKQKDKLPGKWPGNFVFPVVVSIVKIEFRKKCKLYNACRVIWFKIYSIFWRKIG